MATCWSIPVAGRVQSHGHLLIDPCCRPCTEPWPPVDWSLLQAVHRAMATWYTACNRDRSTGGHGSVHGLQQGSINRRPWLCARPATGIDQQVAMALCTACNRDRSTGGHGSVHGLQQGSINRWPWLCARPATGIDQQVAMALCTACNRDRSTGGHGSVHGPATGIDQQVAMALCTACNRDRSTGGHGSVHGLQQGSINRWHGSVHGLQQGSINRWPWLFDRSLLQVVHSRPKPSSLLINWDLINNIKRQNIPTMIHHYKW